MIKLAQRIAPSFFELHQAVKENRYTHYWLSGGRGSGKSSFISIEIILGMMKNKHINAMALRKVGVNLRDSVFAQLEWAIDLLGVGQYWETKISPMEMVYLPTGQKIIFRGADNPKKIKSAKFSKGYCGYIWYEEADEFGGMEEIRSINQSLLRGGDRFWVFYSYNPPKSVRSWVNQEILLEREDRIVHKSTYLDVPRSWLGDQFITEAEHLKKVNPEAYDHEYLGMVTGTGAEVFTNLEIRPITEEEIQAFDRISRGIDWGYAADPFHYTVNHYDKTRKKLYIFFEIQKRRLSNWKAAEMVREENKENGLIICDSAEPKSIGDFTDAGLRVMGAKKGPDSVEYGMKWLQDLEAIIIDPIRCPNTAKEFLEYELEPDGKGGYLGRFPDRDNHSIDAVRYSREMDMRKVKII